jgi:hypothetical protein
VALIVGCQVASYSWQANGPECYGVAGTGNTFDQRTFNKLTCIYLFQAYQLVIKSDRSIAEMETTISWLP